MTTLRFDIESTGLATEEARIVSIAFSKDTEENYYTLVRPEIDIPAESTEIHGISDRDVVGAPTFKEILPQIEAFIESCNVLQAYNGSRFDVYILQKELSRAGSKISVLRMPIIDNLLMWAKGEPRTLEDANIRFLGQSIVDAHNAKADVSAMIQIDRNMRKEFGFNGMTDLEMAAMLKGDNVVPDGKFIWKDGRVIMNWSKKYFGWSVIDVAIKDKGFFEYILRGDGDWLNHGVRSICQKAIGLSRNEVDFNKWIVSEFGPAPKDEVLQEECSSSTVLCPICNSSTYSEPILAGDPSDPDIVDIELICRKNNCDIMGYYYERGLS